MRDFIRYCFAPYSKTKFLFVQTVLCFTSIFLVGGTLSYVSKVNSEMMDFSSYDDASNFPDYTKKTIYNEPITYDYDKITLESDVYSKLLNSKVGEVSAFTCLKRDCFGDVFPIKKGSDFEEYASLSFNDKVVFYTNNFDFIKYKNLKMLYFDNQSYNMNSIVIPKSLADKWSIVIDNFSNYNEFSSISIYLNFKEGSNVMNISGIYEDSKSNVDVSGDPLVFGSPTLYKSVAENYTGMYTYSEIFLMKNNITDEGIAKATVILPNIFGSRFSEYNSEKSMNQIYTFANNINCLVIAINILIYILVLYLINDDVVKNNKIDLIFFKKKKTLLFKMIMRNLVLYVASLFIAVLLDLIIYSILKTTLNFTPKIYINQYFLGISIFMVIAISIIFGSIAYKKTTLMERK